MNRKFLVSTDCAGILSSAAVWKQLWGNTLTDPHCDGVEMIGWQWSSMLMAQANALDITIVGMHGRTAGWSEERSLSTKTIMGLLNMVFVTNKSLCTIGHDLDYILLHRTTITSELVALLVEHRLHIPSVVIENVLSRDDYDKTVEAILYLNEKGIHAGLTFDIVHFLREPEFEEPKLSRFDGLLHTLHKIAAHTFPVNIHFPIGTYENDSLPIEKMSSSMWKELSHAIAEVNPRYVVLENQQQRAYSVFLPPWKYAEVAARNRRIVDFLKEQAIL